MSHHARVEELSDSDPDEVAPSDGPAGDAVISPAPASKPPPMPQQMPQMPQMPMPEPQNEIPKYFQCLYPIYFDKSRSRAEGRKVGAELAVENPLARDIVDAVQMLGFKAGLEPEKLHPKDWANPGRVRVLLKNEDGRLTNPKIKNSKWLTRLLAKPEWHPRAMFHAFCILKCNRLTFDVFRAPSLYPCRAIPEVPPDHRSITLPFTDPWLAHA